MPRARTLGLLAALFCWFGSGVEAWKLGRWEALEADPTAALWPPWRPLRLWASYGGDERLYFEYANLLFGLPVRRDSAGPDAATPQARAVDLAFVARKQQGDPVQNLARLARRVRPGPGARLPYRDFPVEYPPVAVAWMALPRLFAPTLPAYRIAFTAATALLYLALGWVAARLAARLETAPPERVWARLAWLALAVGPLLCQRFDLLPATLTAAALLALCRERHVLAGLLLGVGFQTKLYPALVALPLLALLLGGGRWRAALTVMGAAAGVALLIAAPFLAAAPGPFARAVLLYGARPFQIESLPGALALAAHGGGPVSGGFGSYNVTLPAWASAAAAAALWLGLLALVGLAACAGRRLRAALAAERGRALCALAFAAVAVTLCTSKVLSPQFLIWLLPFPAVLAATAAERAPGRSALYWTVASLALTQAYYPFLYAALRAGHPAVVAVLLARNAALMALAVKAIGAVRAGFVTSAGAPLRRPLRLSS